MRGSDTPETKQEVDICKVGQLYRGDVGPRPGIEHFLGPIDQKNWNVIFSSGVRAVICSRWDSFDEMSFHFHGAIGDGRISLLGQLLMRSFTQILVPVSLPHTFLFYHQNSF